jgi:flagellar biosynthesis protein FlhA
VELEVGYQLVNLVEPDSGDGIASRLSKIRQELAGKLGFAVPAARIKDNLELKPDEFRIKLRGVVISEGRLPRGKLLLAGGKPDAGELGGTPCTLPGLPQPSHWMEAGEQPEAGLAEVEILSPVEVLERHLSHLLDERAHQLLTRAEMSALLEKLRAQCPSLVEEAVPALVSPGELQRVLKNLLEEDIPICDLETILEALSEAARQTRDAQVLTEMVRARLAELISSIHASSDRRLYVLALEPSLEDLLNGAIVPAEMGRVLALPPASASALVEAIANELEAASPPPGAQVVMLCSSHIRRPLRKLVEKPFPGLAVLGYNEVAPTTEVEAVGMIALLEGQELSELSRQVAELVGWPESPAADAQSQRRG